MLHLHPIKNQASPYWDSLVRIYLQSFPIDEQRPVESIARLIEHDNRFVAYAIIKEDENEDLHPEDDPQLSPFISPHSTHHSLLGLLTTWEFVDFIYIEHFAISPALRSQGYGSEALKAFIQNQDKPLVLEAEPPTDEMTRRRIRFYERIGLTLYDYPYTQPAYTEESLPVELRLMGTIDTEATPLDRVSDTLHREVYHTP